MVQEQDTAESEATAVETALDEQVGNEQGDFHAVPPPVPEGQKYLATLGLGRDGVKRIVYDEKVDGVPTGTKKSFWKADVLLKVIGSEDGDTDIAFYQGYMPYAPDGEDVTSFTPKGKTQSGLAHVALLAGVSIADFPAGDYDSEADRAKAYYTALERRLKSEQPIKVVVDKLQWQWRMKGEFTRQGGRKPDKYRTVKYGMSNAAKRDDGTFDPVLNFVQEDNKGKVVAASTEGAQAVSARAVALKVSLV